MVVILFRWVINYPIHASSKLYTYSGSSCCCLCASIFIAIYSFQLGMKTIVYSVYIQGHKIIYIDYDYLLFWWICTMLNVPQKLSNYCNFRLFLFYQFSVSFMDRSALIAGRKAKSYIKRQAFILDNVQCLKECRYIKYCVEEAYGPVHINFYNCHPC